MRDGEFEFFQDDPKNITIPVYVMYVLYTFIVISTRKNEKIFILNIIKIKLQLFDKSENCHYFFYYSHIPCYDPN